MIHPLCDTGLHPIKPQGSHLLVLELCPPHEAFPWSLRWIRTAWQQRQRQTTARCWECKTPARRRESGSKRYLPACPASPAVAPLGCYRHLLPLLYSSIPHPRPPVAILMAAGPEEVLARCWQTASSANDPTTAPARCPTAHSSVTSAFLLADGAISV